MINIPKGTKDVLPSESYKWHYVENIAKDTAKLFGFKEIRTPIFEHTELFLRGVGETTDIVTKEMYTFNDKGGRSMTLRPEGTAGVARCFVENALNQGVIPLRTFYIAPVFRYERPQNGRLREHHQFGVEMFGSEYPEADCEVITLASTFLKRVGLTNLELNINSIGCKECRAKYNKALKEYIGDNLSKMCATCRERFDKNPLRILDCKNEGCQLILKDAPKITDFLCDDCRKHFEEVQRLLTANGIDFVVNPGIVRGLDYYTRTVFEFVSKDIGSQGTVCGGGRYNHLIEEVGGQPTCAIGFGLGLERLLLVLENTGNLNAPVERTTIYVGSLGDAAKAKAVEVVNYLRKNGVSAEYDLMQRGIKPQMKYANKSNCKYLVILGDNEIESGICNLKNMDSGETKEIKIEDLLENVND